MHKNHSCNGNHDILEKHNTIRPPYGKHIFKSEGVEYEVVPKCNYYNNSCGTIEDMKINYYNGVFHSYLHRPLLVKHSRTPYKLLVFI